MFRALDRHNDIILVNLDALHLHDQIADIDLAALTRADGLVINEREPLVGWT